MAKPPTAAASFPGKPPHRWHQLSDAQHQWMLEHFPWYVDGRMPQISPIEFVELTWRGYQLGARIRAKIPKGGKPDPVVTELALRLANLGSSTLVNGGRWSPKA
jgi:hypothetical protein